MATIHINTLTNRATISITGQGIAEYTIPFEEISFRTSNTNAAGTPKDSDLVVMLWNGKELVNMEVNTDDIYINDVAFDKAGGTKAQLISQLDTVFLNAARTALTLAQANATGLANEVIDRTNADAAIQTQVTSNTANIGNGIVGVASTSTNPGTPVTNVAYNVAGAGTYTNFLSAISTPIVVSASDGYVILRYSTTTGFWTKIASPQDLSNYYNKTAADARYPIILDTVGTIPGVDIPVNQWINPRGTSELVGNSTYTNVGIMLHEVLTNKTKINRVVIQAWGATTSAITIKVYKSATFSNNPSSLTLLEEVLFPAGTFNTTSASSTTVPLTGIHYGETGEYIYVFIATTAGTNATVARWTTAAGSGTARKQLYQISSLTNIWTTGWSALSLPSNGSSSFILQYKPPQIAALETIATTNTANILSNTNALTSLSSATKPNVAGTLAVGYIEKVAGIFTSHSSYRSTGFIAIEPLYTVRRLGSALNTVGNASAVSLVAFYDSSRVYLGQLLANITADFSFVPNDYYPTARHIKVTSTLAAGLILYVTPTVLKESVEGLATLQTDMTTVKGKVLKVVNYASLYAKNGFYNTSGGILLSANWRYLEPIACKEGDIFTYKGITSSVSSAVVGWNVSGVATIIYGYLSSQTTQQVTVPAGIVWIAASSRMIGSDVFEFSTETVNLPDGLLNIEIIPEYYMPYKAWAKQGEDFRMNPFGIIAEHPLSRTLDMIWNLENSNEHFLQYTPSTEDTKDITLSVRDNSGNIVSLGTTTLNVTHTIQSPATAQNFIHLGDSTVEGTVSSGIKGAIVNELSRLLTGVGTALLTGSESPAALALSNLYFRGTLGDQPIKHEGRGGWSTLGYLTTSSGNAFWNPGTSAFDLGYYLTQNNFDAGLTTGGVDATGSNLTVIIQLGWNDVYDLLPSQAGTYMKQLIDLIHTQKSAAKVKLVGLPGPAYPNKKSFAGTRNVSPESIMREAMIPYAKEWKSISDLAAYSDFVEFISVAPFFFPEKSYPSTTVTKSLRNSETIEVYTDYVHPNARGYAQVADVLRNNILFNYCKAT